jgi:fructose-1,6-bisphosphatase/sedoheptulose 1,7-bisphosphatase-like protein
MKSKAANRFEVAKMANELEVAKASNADVERLEVILKNRNNEKTSIQHSKSSGERIGGNPEKQK